MNWRVKLVLISVTIPLIYECFKLGGLYFRQTELEQSYALRSSVLRSKYDDELKKRYVFELETEMKLSSHTYDNNALNRRRDKNAARGYQRENATLLMLVRNMELEGALDSMKSLEDSFNRMYHYDWTFMNDVPFSPEFIEATTAMASGRTQYALIPSEDWDRPQWINETRFEEALNTMEEDGVLYGNSKSYRNMCRFNSGYFFRQKILDDYDYYFRVEPDVRYFCDFPYDPFRIMREQQKIYGFVISLYEYENTIESLWDAVSEYIEKDGGHDIDMNSNSYNFLTDKSKIGMYEPVTGSHSDYNLCHFWSNFEIGDLNFFRSEKYIKFFEHLDAKGGFYYERWGDAPVHSIAVALLLNKDEIIHFDGIAYEHQPFNTCPISTTLRMDQRCRCDIADEHNIGITPHSCLMRWWKNGSGKSFLREDN
ncbi:mannosyltransferase YUR1 KNAG_0C02620 [Huiozyma naganishii CBS 8797]|uniref:Glycosyltransferase family 15 protein n=1 Tax=Huiozyma naganishii (strain ATCC MYA-139 / BCRC 22969 / CBS 8797 / KCTC 17520 / NBRC 10181 / NCYC 3082 / Yp74L-3) TaxID=1071383 RepID=J7RIM2_HUIN7|nr:hypothetical protein KNAG_0C02620 [Kazachstania naganishii CBS 8797]CCK69373.1 hypothetical protein KNAG_0C02620 [Kazachstania naganishii CBS 8797]